jgi:ribosomal protein L37E
MPYQTADDWDEDDEPEDWSDNDDDEPEEGDEAPCPECGRQIDFQTDKCPACGYWLSAADRRAMWSGTDKPIWIKIAAVVVLVSIVASLIIAGAALL